MIKIAVFYYDNKDGIYYSGEYEARNICFSTYGVSCMVEPDGNVFFMSWEEMPADISIVVF